MLWISTGADTWFSSSAKHLVLILSQIASHASYGIIHTANETLYLLFPLSRSFLHINPLQTMSALIAVSRLMRPVTKAKAIVGTAVLSHRTAPQSPTVRHMGAWQIGRYRYWDEKQGRLTYEDPLDPNEVCIKAHRAAPQWYNGQHILERDYGTPRHFKRTRRRRMAMEDRIYRRKVMLIEELIYYMQWQAAFNPDRQPNKDK